MIKAEHTRDISQRWALRWKSCSSLSKGPSVSSGLSSTSSFKLFPFCSCPLFVLSTQTSQSRTLRPGGGWKERSHAGCANAVSHAVRNPFLWFMHEVLPINRRIWKRSHLEILSGCVALYGLWLCTAESCETWRDARQFSKTYVTGMCTADGAEERTGSSFYVTAAFFLRHSATNTNDLSSY